MPENFPTFNTDYTDPFGFWKVTTEGDEEGKSPPVHLGTFIGYLDEIAIALSDKAMYTLTFEKTNPEIPAHISCPKKDVHVKLSGPAISDDSKRLALFKQMLEKRPVKVEHSNYWPSVRIVCQTND